VQLLSFGLRRKAFLKNHILIPILLILVLVQYTPAEDLIGFVKDSDTGIPLEGAQVTIVETSTSTVTDATGKYFIPNITNGSYTLMIGYPNQTDYQPYSMFPTFIGTCCIGTTGNINGDPGDKVDISDLTYLVNYLFKGGPTPICLAEVNTNGDPLNDIDVSDLTYFVNFLFKSRPPLSACQ